MLLRRPPSSALEYQELAFEEAERFLADLLPDHRNGLRLRAFLLPNANCSADVLRARFVEGYAESIAPEWTKHLARTGFSTRDPARITFEVVTDPETITDPETVRERLKKSGVAVAKDLKGLQTTTLTLEVDDADLLEGPSARLEVSASDVVYIGRQRRIRDSRGRVVRTNTLAFRDDDALGAISRAQASIRFDADRGRFELYDGEGPNLTQVLRQGQPVERERPLPTPLLDGDLLLLPGDVEIRCLIEAA